jgi:hypothetical protein
MISLLFSYVQLLRQKTKGSRQRKIKNEQQGKEAPAKEEEKKRMGRKRRRKRRKGGFIQ